MLKKGCILFITMLCVIFVIGCVAAPEPSTVTISGHPDWKPVMWQEGDQIVGEGPDTVKAVFEDLGVSLVDSKFVGTWDVVQQKAKTGEIDAIVALYKTKEREEYLYFSIPYTEDPIVLFFKEGNEFAYNEKMDLLDKKGVATIGDSYGQEMDDFLLDYNINILRVLTPQDAFNKLEAGEVDYFIYSLYSGDAVIEEMGLSNIKESSIVSTQLFYIGVSKKSPYANYMEEINNSLKKYIES